MIMPIENTFNSPARIISISHVRMKKPASYFLRHPDKTKRRFILMAMYVVSKML